MIIVVRGRLVRVRAKATPVRSYRDDPLIVMRHMLADRWFAKYRKAFNSLVDIPRAVLKARGKKSPGGKDITTEEYAKIGKEIVEFIEHSAPLFKKVR